MVISCADTVHRWAVNQNAAVSRSSRHRLCSHDLRRTAERSSALSTICTPPTQRQSTSCSHNSHHRLCFHDLHRTAERSSALSTICTPPTHTSDRAPAAHHLCTRILATEHLLCNTDVYTCIGDRALAVHHLYTSPVFNAPQGVTVSEFCKDI